MIFRGKEMEEEDKNREHVNHAQSLKEGHYQLEHWLEKSKKTGQPCTSPHSFRETNKAKIR